MRAEDEADGVSSPREPALEKPAAPSPRTSSQRSAWIRGCTSEPSGGAG